MAVALLSSLGLGCRSARHSPSRSEAADRTYLESGLASWYGPGFYGRRTASGERFDGKSATAAHRTLPFNSLVEVVNLDNGRSLVVRINDRGPFIKSRVIDLSKTAAEELGVLGPGVARVELYLLSAAAGAPEQGFVVQVGAFHEAERARALAGELNSRFGEVEVESDGTWHRVQLGRALSREAAEALRQALQAAGYGGVLVPVSAPDPPGTP